MARILVLDDVLDAVILIEKILTRKGHDIQTFTAEEDAIKHAESNRIDLAILDIKLKKMSGIQVLEQLKKLQPKMKAIMLTGYPTIESAQEAIELGAKEYCVKPIDKQELEEKVAEVLAR
ncbi:response regulator [Desulforhopalus singaporensis]|uniref:Response regulator receiver domain-containing protein n=1 Tax=Desulforhopalus singaporensis TaxID=91360 RepID=A0A1H0QCU9_9BACT|nr:response regulator [Desulforhopalus singaporensis]SDP15144.1 Response regulator receiver domain-containing protein [Desulforhopalus singaporensis]